MVAGGGGGREPLRRKGPLGACRPAGGGDLPAAQRKQPLAVDLLTPTAAISCVRPIWIAQRRTEFDDIGRWRLGDAQQTAGVFSKGGLELGQQSSRQAALLGTGWLRHYKSSLPWL